MVRRKNLSPKNSLRGTKSHCEYNLEAWPYLLTLTVICGHLPLETSTFYFMAKGYLVFEGYIALIEAILQVVLEIIEKLLSLNLPSRKTLIMCKCNDHPEEKTVHWHIGKTKILQLNHQWPFPLVPFLIYYDCCIHNTNCLITMAYHTVETYHEFQNSKAWLKGPCNLGHSYINDLSCRGMIVQMKRHQKCYMW